MTPTLRHAAVGVFVVLLAACGTTEPDPTTTPKATDVDASGKTDTASDSGGVAAASLCAPCLTNKDCVEGDAKDAACLDGGAKGNFCGSACSDTAPCASGYECVDGKDVDGKDVKQCAPTAGACTCSAWAISKGASTTCGVKKDGKTCTGKVTCKADGSLTACDAKAPEAEKCDGVDNDCDDVIDGPATCDDGQACTKDTCDAATSKCKNEAFDSACDDKNVCTKDTCDAKDGCKHAPAEGACDDGSACTSEEACKGGKCVAAKTQDCDDKDDCTTDTCDASSGLCKHAAIPGCGLPKEDSCTGKCGEFNVSWKCQCDSACKTYGDCCKDIDTVCAPKCSSDTQCDDKEKCTKDKCDLGTGKCTFTPEADDSDCDDGQPCTTEKCAAGKCAIVPLTDGSKCEDGNPCTNESCINGMCAKQTKNCNDDDSCTTDSCDKATGDCKHAQKAKGTNCSDAESCTTSDKCTAEGQCVGTAQNDGVNCSDGFTCTTQDRCQTGKCIGTPNDTPCDDKNPCTLDQCGAVKGDPSGCTNKPNKDGEMCQDGDLCTVSDKCKTGVCVGVMKCSALLTDTFECGNKTGWTMAPATGVSWAIDASPKPPGFFSPACSLNYNDGKSYPGTTKGTATSKSFKLPASGAVSLRVQTWDSMEGSNSYDRRYIEMSANGFAGDTHTVQIPNNLKKQQWSLFKTTVDKFSGKDVQVRLRFDSVDSVSNVGPGWFVDDLAVVIEKLPDDLTCTVDHDCPFDGDPCTSQSCTNGKCGQGFSTAACEDGDLCTDKDTCKDGKCQSGPTTNCEDGNDCTDDSCDKAKGCQHKGNTGPCDDGDACTTPDVCFNSACTAVPNTCHDNNPCTTDACNVASGKCTHTKVAACEQKAVKVPWETNFACDTSKAEGWDPEVVGAGPGWAIDGNPTPPAYKSAKCSLNFNDGKNIGCTDGKPLSAKIGVQGTAWSPYFDATGITKGAWLTARFQLSGNWSSSAGKLKVEASSDNGKTWTEVADLKPVNKTDWQVVLLDMSAWATKFFQMRVHFSTSNCSTAYSGPFIDDFKIWDATCKTDEQCDDTNGCTVDKCDVATGKCGYSNAKAKTACDDGNACTSDEICNSAGKCSSGVLKNCNDDNPCTDDACDPGSGDCVLSNKPQETVCSDTNTCTEKDKCDGKGGCVGMAKKSGATCSDANVCTDKDACDGKGICVGAPTAAAGVCNDGNACTDGDKCDGKGLCEGQPKQSGATCTDSDPCTKDACDGKGKCAGAADAAKCDDKDPCTIDSCIKQSTFNSNCKHTPTPDGTKCDDGTACTDNDACTGGVCKGAPLCNFKTIWEDKFDCGSKDWVMEPVGGAGKVGWQIDGLPAPPAYKSEKCSLNYNDDKTFPGKTTGKATSKAIEIPAKALHALLKVWSYHGVEKLNNYDKRFIEVSDDDFTKNIITVQLDNAKDEKAWAEVSVSLAAWLGKTIKVRFRFDTIDSANNDTPGWFVDDLVVEVGTKK